MAATTGSGASGRQGALAALALLAVAAACAPPPGPPAPALPPGEWRTFEGTWSAAGERHVLDLGPGRRAAVATLAGSMFLTGERGLGAGFQARAITFSDPATGAVGRAAWTDERGDQIFSELTGQPVASGHRIHGTFVGGTGRWSGLTGAYDLTWQFVVEAEGGVVQGRAVELKGRARLGAPDATPPGGRP